MKLKIILILSILAGSFQSFAQTEVGFYVLPLRTKMVGDDNDYLKLKTTFAGGAGASVKFGLNNFLIFETGLLYTSQNQKFIARYQSGKNIFIEHEGKKRLDYLKVPLLLKYRQLVSDKTAINAYAGPQFSYLIKGDGGVVAYKKSEGDYDYFDLPKSTNSQYNKYLLEAVIGLGADYYLNENVSLNGGVRVDYGISDVENKKALYNNELLYSSKSKTHNLTYGLLLGVSYRLGDSDHLSKPSMKGHQRMHKGRKDITKE